MVFWKKKSSSVSGDFLEGGEVVDECDVDLGTPRPAGRINQSIMPRCYERKNVICG